jgi:hypothetical protein
MSDTDYLSCTRCGGKVIYDADVDYAAPTFGAIWALCANCSDPELEAIVAAILQGHATIQIGEQ